MLRWVDQTPLQRCVFHKLRNLAQAIKPPAALDCQVAKEYRTSFLRLAAQIWQATDEFEARQRYCRAILFHSSTGLFAVTQQLAARFL